VHQSLAVRPEAGRSGMPLRPDWDATHLVTTDVADQDWLAPTG